MPDFSYFFIDGGYIRSRYAEAMKRVFGVEEAEPDIAKLQRWCYPRQLGNAIPRRFFYYDCLQDIQKQNETNDEFKRRVDRQNAVFRALQSLHGFHVRLGSMTGTQKKMRQKKVDVLLAVEMLDNAFRKNMDVAVLIAGDADFTPLIEAVMRLGTWVEVCYHRRGASEDLYSAADHGMQLTFHDLWNWSSDEFQIQHPLPDRFSGIEYVVGVLLPRKLKTGKNIRGEAITVAERGDKPGEFFIYEHRPGDVTLITHSNREVLEKYYTEQFGNIVWDTHVRANATPVV